MKNRVITLKEHVALTITLNAWWNHKQADTNLIDTSEGGTVKGADKEMLHLTKTLLQSDEYNAVRNYQNSTKKWLSVRSMPAFIHKSVYLFSADMVEEVEKYLTERKAGLQDKVDKFLSVYAEQIEDARKRLDNLFNANDYPTAADIRSRFRIESAWTTFEVPKGLPSDIYKTEKAKAEAMWSEAAEQIRAALRLEMQKLVTNMAERLTVVPGAPPKQFKQTSIDTMYEFFEAFNMRNLTSDEDLAKLVIKAKAVLEGCSDAEMIRDNDRLREYIGMKFSDIKNGIDSMIEETPTRKFRFD